MTCPAHVHIVLFILLIVVKMSSTLIFSPNPWCCHSLSPFYFQAHGSCEGDSRPQIGFWCCYRDLLASSTASGSVSGTTNFYFVLLIFIALFLFVSSVFSFLPPSIPLFSLSVRAVLRGREAKCEFSYERPEDAMGTVYPPSFIALISHEGCG